MNGNILAIMEKMKKEIGKHMFDLFSGIAWNRFHSGKTLAESLNTAMEMTKSFIQSREKQNPNNSVVKHMNEFANTQLKKFMEHAKTNPHKNKMPMAPKDKLNEELARGAKWTNDGIAGLDAAIKKYPISKNLLPYQVAIMMRQNMRAA